MFPRRFILAAALISAGCSSGPEQLQPGTPAFQRNAAKENWAKADFPKTMDQLTKLAASQNEFAAGARVWNLVILSGLAKAHIDLANSFESGARQNKSNPTSFRKQMMDNRSLAAGYATQFSEGYDRFLKAHKEAEVPLIFPSPGGSAARSPLLDKIASGFQTDAAEVDSGQRDVVRRSILLAACSVAGTPNDSARAGEVLKSESAKVENGVFFKAMGESLHEQSALFGKDKLGKPDFQKHFLGQASEALKKAKEDKETKELQKKIEGELKAMK